MKKSVITVILTTVVTTIVVIVILIALLPIIGPRYLHPLMSSVMHGTETAPLSDLDTASSRLTDNGLFRVSYTSELDPVSIGQIHSWTLYIETANGQPVENAVITVGGGMPQHKHGLPTRPQVTAYLGEGNYRVEGLKFQMSGWWEVTFDITTGSQSDRLTFNLILEG